MYGASSPAWAVISGSCSQVINSQKTNLSAGENAVTLNYMEMHFSK